MSKGSKHNIEALESERPKRQRLNMDTSKEWVDIISKRLALTIEGINFLASNGRGIGSKDLPERINALAGFLVELLSEIRNEPSIGADFRRLEKVALEGILHDMEVKKL